MSDPRADPAPVEPARAEFEGWEAWYSSKDYRQMPWYSPRPSPWLVKAWRDHWFPRGARVLDVGCGSGSNVLWLARQGARAVGVDLSPTAIAAASARARRARVEAEFRVANATELPFPDASYDAALDTGCFHSLPLALRDRYALEMHRVLRPAGAFLLTWIPREVRTDVGPPHRPSLAEVAAAFEAGFIFEHIERHESGSSSGWSVRGDRVGRCTARLVRRSAAQPPAW